MARAELAAFTKRVTIDAGALLDRLITNAVKKLGLPVRCRGGGQGNGGTGAGTEAAPSRRPPSPVLIKFQFCI